MTALATALLAGLLCGQAEPAALVKQLGSDRFSEREEAAESLFRTGVRALPALRDAVESDDLELRRRARELIPRIERAEVLRSTRVSLDFSSRPVGEVAEAIGSRTGMRLVPGAGSRSKDGPASWPDRRISLEAPEPVPFWEAIDRLCRRAGMRRRLSGNSEDREEHPGALVLVPGRAEPPACDSGVLRVELLRLHRDLDVKFVSDPDGERFRDWRLPRWIDREKDGVSSRSFFADLLVSTGPRLRPYILGPIRDLEVEDDQGRSMRQASLKKLRAHYRVYPQSDPFARPEIHFRGGGSTRSVLTWRVVLDDPVEPGRRIARLKGAMTVVMLAYPSEPRVIPLAGNRGRVIEAEGARIEIKGVRAEGVEAIIDLELRPDPLPGPTPVEVAPGVVVPVEPPSDLVERQLGFLDESGEPVPWDWRSRPSNVTWGRMTIRCYRPGKSRPLDPDSLRLQYSRTLVIAAEVPFEFTDLPVP